MTTTVIVRASGSHYPAKVITTRGDGWPAGEPVMVASGEEKSFHVGQGCTLLVTEEYHKDGYPPFARTAEV